MSMDWGERRHECQSLLSLHGGDSGNDLLRLLDRLGRVLADWGSSATFDALVPAEGHADISAEVESDTMIAATKVLELGPGQTR